MTMTTINLDIKVANLAMEARILRRKERAALRAMHHAKKLAKDTTNDEQFLHALQRRRAILVRPEARAAHLAQAFLRGYDYKDIERFAYTEPNWHRISFLISIYSDDDPRVVGQKFAEWEDNAKAWFKKQHICREEYVEDYKNDPMRFSPFSMWLNKWLAPWNVFFGI